MAKLFDYISLTVVAFMLTFVWTALLFDSAAPALILSSALTLIVAVTVRYIVSKVSKPYTYDRLALEFLIRGNGYVISLLSRLVKNPDVARGDNYILFENSVLISAYKSSPLGISDVGGVCTLAKKHGRNKIFLICRTVERRAYTVAQLEGVKLAPVKVKTIFNILKKRNALPSLAPAKEKISARGLLGALFARSNFKAYAFSGTVLILVSFITPLKIYYIAMGSVSLLLALLTLTPLGSGNFMSARLTSELENAISSKPNQMSIDELDSKNDE